MQERLNLYYIFLEEKEQLKLSEEKSAEIWRKIEDRFCAPECEQSTTPKNTGDGIW